MQSPMKRVNEREFMELAIDEMTKSVGSGPRVGAVIVAGGKVVSTAHRRPELHAERAAIEQVADTDVRLKGSTLYTTLEPCVAVSTNQARESCASLISRSGISTVVIGRYDINPRIYREGWKALRDAGITLKDFPADLRERLDALNAEFVGHFGVGVGPSGGAEFDYTLNDEFQIRFSEIDDRSIVTRWSMAGKGAIHAYARPQESVSLARHAKEFVEIYDPTAFYPDSSIRVEEGEIAVFVGTAGCALVKVVKVHSGPRFGSDRISVRVHYEIRIAGDEGICN